MPGLKQVDFTVVCRKWHYFKLIYYFVTLLFYGSSKMFYVCTHNTI